ncbi:MAG TPA: PIG-L family deacetylase [Thermoanaerobaculia bacterium]|nr:PIG-L family deacetylase [Thermoanaerobaculia bacterium]
MADFLLVSPHVDDEVLGCGGVLDERFHVHYCGVEPFREVSGEERRAEARAAAELLGFTFSLDDDRAVNAYRVEELVGRIEVLVAEHRPATVLLPCASYNQDHRAVLDAGLTALRPHDRNPWVANVLLYEQVHAVLWPHREDLTAGRAFQPTLLVPIDLERKLAAYRCHASQLRAMRSPEAVATLARWRGLQAGCEHAEGFLPVRVTDPVRLDLGRLRRGS